MNKSFLIAAVLIGSLIGTVGLSAPAQAETVRKCFIVDGADAGVGSVNIGNGLAGASFRVLDVPGYSGHFRPATVIQGTAEFPTAYVVYWSALGSTGADAFRVTGVLELGPIAADGRSSARFTVTDTRALPNSRIHRLDCIS